jgi:hypothetical protein
VVWISAGKDRYGNDCDWVAGIVLGCRFAGGGLNGRRWLGAPCTGAMLTLGRQSRLHTAFSIQLGKRLFQLIELLACLAVLALGGQPLIV